MYKIPPPLLLPKIQKFLFLASGGGGGGFLVASSPLWLFWLPGLPALGPFSPASCFCSKVQGEGNGSELTFQGNWISFFGKWVQCPFHPTSCFCNKVWGGIALHSLSKAAYPAVLESEHSVLSLLHLVFSVRYRGWGMALHSLSKAANPAILSEHNVLSLLLLARHRDWGGGGGAGSFTIARNNSR